MNNIWHKMNLQSEIEPNWEFDDPLERDYWNAYNAIIQTIGEVSINLIMDDPENFADIVNVHQCYALLPLEITVIGEDTEEFYGYGAFGE